MNPPPWVRAVAGRGSGKEAAGWDSTLLRSANAYDCEILKRVMHKTMLYPVLLLSKLFIVILTQLQIFRHPEPSTYPNHVHHHRIPLRSLLQRAQLFAMTLAIGS